MREKGVASGSPFFYSDGGIKLKHSRFNIYSPDESQMFLPSPAFFCTCLNLNLERVGRVQWARVVDCGEPCVRRWYRENSFPQEAVDKWIDYVSEIGGGRIKAELDDLMKEPFRASADANTWRFVCQGLLANEAPLLPYTFGTILSDSGQWLEAMSSGRKLDENRRFDFFKAHLLNVVGPKFNLPAHLQKQIAEGSEWESLRPAIDWLVVENFIYYLAMAEAECLLLYHRIKEPKLSRVILPKLHKGKVQYPIKLFFGYFFDNLVSRGLHSSLGDIARRIPRVLPLDKAGKESGKSRSRVDEDSGWRELKRAKYQGKAPAFETFRAWIDALIPPQLYPSSEERELEKQLLCDALGAARIVDRFFREVSKDIPEVELVGRFESYETWRQFHSATIIVEPQKGPGMPQALSP